MPVVVGDEAVVVVAYLLPDDRDPATDSTAAFVTFRSCRAVYFGQPNDEAIEGHPLAGRGLEDYGAYEVRPSSWIAALERQNSVHDRHDPAHLASDRHFALVLHDSIFECVAESIEAEVLSGTLIAALPRMIEILDHPGA